jgi:hypothetical protein
VIARQSVWSNPEIQELLTQFVASADEVHRLQTGSDPEAKLAQKVFEQGHYAGRTQPSSTRQGIYATAPSGVMLASVNHNDPKVVANMLRRALQKWDTLTEAERFLDADPNEATASIRRPESFYPLDGLALRVFTRDLPREEGTAAARADWRQNAWNQDYAWFRRSEAVQFVPAEPAVGVSTRVPEPLVRRIAKLNFVDIVRGQTPHYQDKDIEIARLDAEVVRVAGDRVWLRLTGETKAAREGRWPIAGFEDAGNPQPQKMGMHLNLLGYGVFDRSAERFQSFEMVALGTRYGATQYNGRRDDLGPAPIGFYLVKTGQNPGERVAPSFFWAYGWR